MNKSRNKGLSESLLSKQSNLPATKGRGADEDKKDKRKDSVIDDCVNCDPGSEVHQHKGSLGGYLPPGDREIAE